MDENKNFYEDAIDVDIEHGDTVPSSASIPTKSTMEDLDDLAQLGAVLKDLDEEALQEWQEKIKLLSKDQSVSSKNLSTKELNKFFQDLKKNKEALEKTMVFHKFIMENKSLVRKIFDVEQKRKGKFRQSAHFVEQKLSYQKPSVQQLNLFDELAPETREKVKNETVSFIGIRLSPPEDKLVNSISRLLEQKSETGNRAAENFYMGNEPYALAEYGGGGKKQKAAVLRFKKRELIKEFFGTKNPSGDDIRYFERIFNSFLEKKWLIRYTRTVSEKTTDIPKRKIQKKDEERFYVVEDYCSLIRVLQYFPNLSRSELSQIEKGNEDVRLQSGEFIIALSPILTDQIDSKYVEFPEDIDYRTKIAAGSHLAVSEAVVLLRDWLITEMSAGRYEVEINKDNLVYKLRLEKHLKSRKKDRIHQQINKAIKISQHLGIILDVEEVCGAKGQEKVVFKLNKGFE